MLWLTRRENRNGKSVKIQIALARISTIVERKKTQENEHVPFNKNIYLDKTSSPEAQEKWKMTI